MAEKKIKFVNGNMVEYEIYNLVDCYDPILHTPTQEVSLEQLGDRRFVYYAMSIAETLNKIGGLGLSANQVGIPYKICAINMGDKIWMMINPEVTWKSEETSEYKEGCLSYPGLYLHIGRPAHIKVKFNAVTGQVMEQEFDGLTATVIQHEIDHLNGICYTKLVSPTKLEIEKRRAKKNLKKFRRATGVA